MYALPHVTDVFILHRVVEWEVLEFILPSGIENWILFHELPQDFLELFVMHKTEMPHENVVLDVQKKGIKLRMKF